MKCRSGQNSYENTCICITSVRTEAAAVAHGPGLGGVVIVGGDAVAPPHADVLIEVVVHDAPRQIATAV